MRIASFTHNDKHSFGIVTQHGIIDLAARTGHATLRDMLAGGDIGAVRKALGDTADIPLAAVTWNPVIPNPGKIVCVGLNYRTHVEETGKDITVRPLLFSRFNDTQVGHKAPLIRPAESIKFDYEGELALVIGKAGRRIDENAAWNHVAGYACYNDVSVRDWQTHTSQYLPGKNFAATGAFGPWMVPAQDFPDIERRLLTTRLNGEIVQSAHIGDMITPIPQLIAYISTFIALAPGDVIVTGTPGGVGAKRTPPLWLKNGDVCEVEIEGIGLLSNPVIDE